MVTQHNDVRSNTRYGNDRQQLTALAGGALLACLLVGCATLPVGTPGIGYRTVEPAAEPLDLSGLDLPKSMPNAVDKRSPFDLVTAAAYLGTHKPNEATRTYVGLVKRHGCSYEPAFARDALQSGVACAWTSGDPALIRSVLLAYDRRLDVIERAPEPRWLSELRCFFRVKDDERLARAYDQLTVHRQKVTDPLLRRRVDRWLERHRSACLALLGMFRDDAPGNWDTTLLEDLVEAEANLCGGHITGDSGILLYSQARALVNGTREAGTATHVVAVAKVFLTSAGLVRQPDGNEFMLGNTYAPRS